MQLNIQSKKEADDFMQKLTKRILTGLALSLTTLTFAPALSPTVYAAGLSDVSKNTIETSKVMAKIKASYADNKVIVDNNYDKSLAAHCINGTFVGINAGDNIIEYRGIPFVGEQPVNDYRWKPPVEFKKSTTVYEAYHFAKSPCQSINASEPASMYVQGEDCLYLNIYKAKNDLPKKPVMVWFHGGAFEQSGTADPTYNLHNLIKENPDIIAVTITYRLGALGFLHLSHLPDGADYPDAQNLGILDQKMALKWVKENIANFGGDPDNITIFGESAGAASVTLLPIVPGAKQYFNKVIAQSGTPVFTRTPEQSITCSEEVFDKLNCHSVSDLKKMSAQQLVEASDGLSLRVWPERDDRTIPADPYAAYERGDCKDIPIITGCNKDELGYFVYWFGGPEGFSPWADQRQALKYSQLNTEELAKVKDFFSELKGERYEKTSELFNHIVFKAPMIRILENQSNAGGKAYGYFFTVESARPYMLSGHGMELSSVLNSTDNFRGRKFDETFSKTMRKMWIQFAKTGDPSIKTSPDGKEHTWPLYETTEKKLMVFDEFDIHTSTESALHLIDWGRTYFLTKYFCI